MPLGDQEADASVGLHRRSKPFRTGQPVGGTSGFQQGRPPLDTEIDKYISIMKGALDTDRSFDSAAGKNWASDQMSSARPDLIAGVLP